MNQHVTIVRDQQWLAMVSEQKKSGLTIKAWCSENGISENGFYYRQQKLRKRIGSALPTFVEIKPLAEKMEAQHLENMNSIATFQIGSVMIGLSNQQYNGMKLITARLEETLISYYVLVTSLFRHTDALKFFVFFTNEIDEPKRYFYLFDVDEKELGALYRLTGN